MANIKIMRDSWTGKGTAAPVARALNKAGRCVNGIRVEGGGNVQKFGNNIVIPRTISTGISFAKFSFGFTISGATVTIKAGDWPLGETEASMDDTDVIISADYQYVGLEVDPVAATIQVIGPSTSKAFFLPGGGKFRTWLHQFRFTPSTKEGESGRASFERTHLGSIFMPGHYNK
jgi:hypothetical protein